MSPGQAGRNDVDVYLHASTAEDPLEQEPLDARATARLPEQGIGPIDLRLEPVEAGHWSAEDVDLLPAGDWVLTATVRLTEVDEARTETTVPIR